MALEDRMVIQGLISSFHLNSASQESYEKLVEGLAVHCRLELIYLKRIYEDLFMNSPNDQKIIEENMKKAFTILHPLIKQNRLKCLREDYEHLDSLSNPTTDRRKLLNENTRKSMPPLPKLSDLRNPGLKVNPPSMLKHAFSVHIRAQEDSEGKVSAQEHTNAIILSCGVTAVVTFSLATVLFVCCRKALDGALGDDHKDDKPLLGLSTVDSPLSGSPPTPLAMENTEDKEKNSNQSYASDLTNNEGDINQSYSENLSDKEGDVYVNGDSLLKSTHDGLKKEANIKHLPQSSSCIPNKQKKSFSTLKSTFSALKLPTGRLSVSPSRIFPMRPFPARAKPPEPQPPASLSPSSSVTNPPPPSPSQKPSGLALPPNPPPNLSGNAPPPPSLPPPFGNSSGSAPPPPPPPGRHSGPASPGPPPPPLPGLESGGPRPPMLSVKVDDDASKAKLKPFFWDKVLANPNHAMVWHHLKSGSFQFDEEMIESLFRFSSTENKTDKKKEAPQSAPQFIQIVDRKKAQNLSILLKALNVTIEDVSGAVLGGNELPPELIDALLKMAPTTDEELKLRLFTDSPALLGPTDRFMKVLVDIPFAYRRLEALYFMGTLRDESTVVKESFKTLEAACEELKNSRLFLKLLEAVLKTGNRMNSGTYRGGAQAFKLDTLLKLADVKGTDGKTTLLHFVVQEIIRSEGVRAFRAAREKSEDLMDDYTEEDYRTLGLQAVSGLGEQLENVRKAANLDADSITGTLSKLGSSFVQTRNFLNKEMIDVVEDNGFVQVLKTFVPYAETEVTWLMEEEKKIMTLVKDTGDYFHGNPGKEEGLRLFLIVRNFLTMLEKVCKEVKDRPRWTTKAKSKEPPSRQVSTEGTPRTPFSPDLREKLFPAIAQQRQANKFSSSSSSDDDG